MNDHEPMLAKIRKLLAKAEDPAATEEEAELYTAKAAALIADYGIDQALLAAGTPGSGTVGDLVVELEAPYAKDKSELLADVAVRLRCRAVLRTRREPGGKVHSVHLFGHRSDLDRTEMLFTSLLLQASTWMVRAPVPARESKASFRRSWLAGFRMAIVSRLAETERRAEETASERTDGAGRSAGLVLAERSAHVARRVAEVYPRLSSARPRRLSGSGMQDGYVAGQRADLGGAAADRFTGSRRPLPS